MEGTMITDEQAEDLIPGDIAREAAMRIGMTKAQYIEKMAAAYVVLTNIPADQCMLVQEALEWPQVGYRFYFQRRR
jgi:hypothetical protein